MGDETIVCDSQPTKWTRFCFFVIKQSLYLIKCASILMFSFFLLWGFQAFCARLFVKVFQCWESGDIGSFEPVLKTQRREITANRIQVLVLFSPPVHWLESPHLQNETMFGETVFRNEPPHLFCFVSRLPHLLLRELSATKTKFKHKPKIAQK